MASLTSLATTDQLRKVSNSPRHKRRRRRRSRLLIQRRTQQDHWRSTHYTKDNITTGRDVPRTDGSAVPPQQSSSQLTTAFMTDQKKRPDSSHVARRPGTTSKDCHFTDEHVLLTYDHVSDVSLSYWPQRPAIDWLSGLTDELNIADCVSFMEVRYTLRSNARSSRPCHTRRILWQTTTHNNVFRFNFLQM